MGVTEPEEANIAAMVMELLNATECLETLDVYLHRMVLRRWLLKTWPISAEEAVESYLLLLKLIDNTGGA